MTQTRLTNGQKLAINRHKDQSLFLKHKALKSWTKEQFGIDVTLATIGNILKRKQELSEMSPAVLTSKKPRVTQNPQLEEALAYWILQCQMKKVSLTGNMIK